MSCAQKAVKFGLKEVGEDRIVQKPFREADLAEKIGRSLRMAYD